MQNPINDPNIPDRLEVFGYLVKVLVPPFMFLIGTGFAFVGYTGIIINGENKDLASFGVTITFGGGVGTGIASRDKQKEK